MPQTQMERIRFKLVLLREIRQLQRDGIVNRDKLQAAAGYIALVMLAEGGWN